MVKETNRQDPLLLGVLGHLLYLNGDAEAAVRTLEEALALPNADRFLRKSLEAYRQ